MMRRLQRLYASSRFWHLGVGPAVLVYGIALYAFGQMRLEHALLLGGWLVVTYVPRLRALAKGLLPFFLFGLLYDALRFVTPFAHAHVAIHVEGPYRLELQLFGWRTEAGDVVIPSEALTAIRSPVVLLAAGFAYFFFIYEVFLFAIYLLVKDRLLVARFGWTFLLLCIVGFVTYYVYPAAPPWYVAQHGLGPADVHALPDAARLREVDALLGVSFFASFYARSSNVFGAIPSLHAAYPLLVWFYARRSPLARWHWAFLAFFLLMCFSAVFLYHHYLIDVILGAAYALGAYGLMEGVLYRGAVTSQRVVHAEATLDQRA